MDMQEQLLSKQVANRKKDLSKAIQKAKQKFEKAEIQAQRAMLQQKHRSVVRGAFVVFQRTQFAEDVVRSAPTGVLCASPL